MAEDENVKGTSRFVPGELVDSIQSGRCIAFVGAGFSIPSTPTWPKLLERLIGRVQDAGVRKQLLSWLHQKGLTGRDYEGIAAAVEAEMGSGFHGELRAVLGKEIRGVTKRRLAWLKGIPFHYVLTTNFDGILGRARTPSPEVYAEAISAARRPWWSEEYWGGSADALWRDRLIALHGQCDEPESVIFTTESYRRHLHESAAYRGFLRALFATHNVLYLGFSFNDAYINDLRSEILAVIGLEGSARKLRDYAILEDIAEPAREHLERYDGLVALPFDTAVEGVPKSNFAGFDEWLQAIHDVTNPRATLRSRLAGQRVVWMDPKPENNRFGVNVLRTHARTAVQQVTSVDDALRAGGKASCGLLITRWGHRECGGSDALDLLQEIKRPTAPVVVFASGEHREKNREKAIRQGAYAYADTWSELMEIIDERFNDSRRRPRRSGEVAEPHHETDGVICPSSYAKATPKVLFVLREPGDDRFLQFGSLREWVLQTEAYSPTFLMLGRWAGALVGKPIEDHVRGATLREEVRRALSRVAVINVNKTPQRPSDPDELAARAMLNLTRLRKQIARAEPDVIVGCGVTTPLVLILGMADAFIQSRTRVPTAEDEGVHVVSRGGLAPVLLTRHPGQGARKTTGQALARAWKRTCMERGEQLGPPRGPS